MQQTRLNLTANGLVHYLPDIDSPFYGDETLRAFDVDRCVALHNEIMTIGWEGRQRYGKGYRGLGQSWFDFHGAAAEAVRDRLHPDLFAFLESAWEAEDDQHSFFYYVAGLSYPTHMFKDDDADPNTELGNSRYVTLYTANDIAEHQDGLIYDQETHTAIIQMDILDSFTTRNGRQAWHSLATVLEAWLDMIRVGKIKVTEDHAFDDPPDLYLHKFGPWINVPYSDSMLEETVYALDELIYAIETRIPGASDADSMPENVGLVDEYELERSGIPAGLSGGLPTGFARAVLQSEEVRRPTFKYIAPGLMVPSAMTLSQQPFRNVAPDPPNDPDNEISLPPILLFRSEQNYTAPPQSDVTGSDLPFSWPYNQVTQYPAGLYFAPVDHYSANDFEDECKLVLPFGIGSRGFARKSDGTRFGENTESPDVKPRDTFAALYQPGYQPFVEMHGVRLVKVIESWTQMVENGDWDVDENGVAGGMEEWKKADTIEGWSKFVVPIGW